MSASPWAVVGFIVLVILMWNTGTPPAVFTGVFLLYAPAWLLGEYLLDCWRFRDR